GYLARVIYSANLNKHCQQYGLVRMAIEITVPRLGWSMDEGVFGEWLKADGEFVRADDPIFTLESEKALQEVESVDEGYLSILAAGPAEGETVAVGTLVAYLLAEGEQPPGPDESTDRTGVPSEPLSAESAAVAAPSLRETAASAAKTSAQNAVREEVPARNSRTGLPAISPRAARLAQQSGIDWTQLRGSGRSGRIRECDVQAALKTAQTEYRSSQRPLTEVRRIISDRMLQTANDAALVTLTARVDATHLIALREQFKVSGEGPVPAYHDIVAKIVAVVLKRYSIMKLQRSSSGTLEREENHIGLAVDTDAGLFVPVIRHVDRLSLEQITIESRRLIERAQRRECSPDELSGGTFSITNLGSLGVDHFTPRINLPQSSILGLGAIRREAVVVGADRIEARAQLPLSLTFDHCLIDGAPAARFLQAVSAGIENPGPLLIR
ncbi:MAG: dihydrolipoamide acetyltransferase family protein, partial [Planctomycetaceae bacterium]